MSRTSAAKKPHAEPARLHPALRVRLMERTLRALRQRQADRRKRNRDLWGEEVLFVDRLDLPGESALAGEAIAWAAGAGVDALIFDAALTRASASIDHALVTVASRKLDAAGARLALAGGWEISIPRSPAHVKPPKKKQGGVVLATAPAGYWGMDTVRADALRAPFRLLKRWRSAGRKIVALGFSNADTPYAVGSLCTALVGPAANASSPGAVLRGLAKGLAAWSNGPLIDCDCNGVAMGEGLKPKGERLEVSFRVADVRGVAKVRCFVGDKVAREFSGKGMKVLDVVFLLESARGAPFVRLDAVTTDGCWAFTNPVWLG
ncbi:MAG: hypothetical protein HY291_08640 [Planctomycetes bacterium]|nr:hypothetical protein [Planctomycetota bacterium]